MYDYNDNSYTYSFDNGINYFVGKNNSGKTEFYKFIDYMFNFMKDISDDIYSKNAWKIINKHI